MQWIMDICGISLGLSVDRAGLGRRLREHFAPFEKEGPAVPVHTLKLNQDRILIDGRVRDSRFPTDPALVLDRICFWINTILYQEAKDYLLIHAGVVERNERAYVFPADSGKGKSTLTAWLLLNGWGFMSDHLAVISLGDDKVYPFPIPVKLKEPPEKILGLLRIRHDVAVESDSPDNGAIHHVRCTRNIPSGGYPVGAFIFLNRGRGREPGLRQLRKRELLSSLVPQCVNLSFQTRDGYDLLFRLVEKVPGYELQYEDVWQLGDFSAVFCCSCQPWARNSGLNSPE